jgi:hypothetical protein
MIESDEHDPGPVPEYPGELTDEEYANLHNTIDVMHFIFTQMLQDLPASGSVYSMYAPFQPLVRSVMIAAVAYYRDNGQPELQRRAQELLDSGKLDSATVARAPSAQEVTGIVMELADWDREKFADERAQVTAQVRSVIADAMDCAYKQAIAAPQTRGSRFARRPPEPDRMLLTPREVTQLERALDESPPAPDRKGTK